MAASTNGFIKLHRKLLDNPVVCKDSDHFAIWIYLLLNATHKSYRTIFRGEQIELNPGQLITGRKSISAYLKINEYKVQRILKLFENEQQIAQQTSTQNRLISVVNWDLYQANAHQDEQPLHNECTTDAQRIHTNKNVKNEKNDKNDKKHIADYLILDSLSQPLSEKMREFIESRRALKSPLSENAVKLIIEKLRKLSEVEADQIEILNQSIMNGWKGIFELRQKGSASQKQERRPEGWLNFIDEKGNLK